MPVLFISKEAKSFLYRSVPLREHIRNDSRYRLGCTQRKMTGYYLMTFHVSLTLRKKEKKKNKEGHEQKQ